MNMFYLLCKRLGVAGICCCFTFSAFAQLNNTLLCDRISMEVSDTSNFGIALQANPYMRNTEYFSRIELGRTLFGYQLQPSIYLQPHAHIRLQAGSYLRKDYGSNTTFSRVLPTFTVKIQSGHHAFLFGTLEGALAHGLIEPLWDINSNIERRIENGFQYRLVSPKTFADVWINWERFIERGSPYKEQFTTGFHFAPQLISKKKTTLTIPLQFTAFHRGGQIDTDTGKVIMYFNGAAGLVLKTTLSSPVFKSWTASAYSVFNRENTQSGYFAFRNGIGTYANLALQTRWMDFMLSYWNGNNYIAPRGTAIYQSVSADQAGYTEAGRQLLFFRLLYEKELYAHLNIVIRYEPFIDLGNKQFDYAFSVYLLYRENFSLGNF
jgi:hypothetical protein